MINKNKPLARLTMKKSERTQIFNIRNERGDVSIDPMAIKKIIKAL